MSRAYQAPGSRLWHLAADRAMDVAQQTGDMLGRDQVTIGVTGLSRSGKTLFITTALNNLTHAKRFDLFAPIAQGRLEAAHFGSPPSATTPRFAFEANLDALYAAPPQWPRGTTRVSQIQAHIKTRTEGLLGGLMTQIGAGKPPLSVNMIDYPGEWLTDLPMLRQGFEAWSAHTLDAAGRGARQALSAHWLALLAQVDLATQPFEPRLASQLAEAYRAYLLRCRAEATQLSRLQPGRFLVPGDLEGSDALTFCPLPALPQPGTRPGGLYREFARRMEAYKAQVIAPFFDEHIARIDRQIVLVDLLSVINGGLEAVDELRETLSDIMQFFRPGENNPLRTLFTGRRVERLMFVASKADHLPPSQHGALSRLLESLLFDQTSAAQTKGASLQVSSISALRAALPATTTRQGRTFECVTGVPRGGDRPRLYYPGALPDSWQTLKQRFADPAGPGLSLLDFEPPVDLPPPAEGLPQLRVDAALSFLIGDLL